MCVFFFKQKTAYEMRISDWSSDVCSSDLGARVAIDHHDVVVVDASVDHARSADAEDETCRPIEPQQLDQAYGVVLPVLGRAWKAGSCCTNDPENGPLRHVGKRDRLHQRQHQRFPSPSIVTPARPKGAQEDRKSTRLNYSH